MNKAVLILLFACSLLIGYVAPCKAEKKPSEGPQLRRLYQRSSTGKKIKSKLEDTQRGEYEKTLALTQSFALSLKFLPKIFEPEKASYRDALNWVIILFVLISLFPLGVLLFYVIMRFVFKKCRGPMKSKDITPVYKMVTWVLLAVSVAGITVMSVFILTSSEKVKNGFNGPLERYIESIDSIQNSVAPLAALFESIYPHLTTSPVDKAYFEALSADLTNYVTLSKGIISKVITDESVRNAVAYVFCFIYLAILIIAVIAFYRRWKKVCVILSLTTFLTLPALVIIEGYSAYFYFNSSNICSSVYSSMYQSQFPVSGSQIGYYFNCFDKSINSKLFALNYLVDEAKSNLSNKELLEDIQSRQKEYLDKLLLCNRVYTTLPDLEDQFCYKGIDWLSSILVYYPWLILLVFVFGLALDRVEIHIWKNKLDIKSIIENSVILY